MPAAPELLACRACKKQKRRCDKAVPKCSLCRRTGRTCEYSEAPDPPPTAAVFAALRSRLGELEQRLDAHTTPNTIVSDEESPAAPYRTSSGDVGGPHKSGSSTVSSSLSALPYQHAPEFPAMLFLDIDCFIWSGLQLPDPSVGIPTVRSTPNPCEMARLSHASSIMFKDECPHLLHGCHLQAKALPSYWMDVLTLLTQGNVLVNTSTDYFSTIHTWMPIVSKKRMDLGLSVRNGGPDIAILFVAMKLITAQAAQVVDGTLYSIAKGFLSSLERSGVVSLLCLQAMVLIALYEYSHSIYPAAWMTVGACARYAEILKLSCGEMDMSFMRKVNTWTEVEERRRVWWAIFILDRLISIGSRRSCSVPDPPSDGKLPVDDDAWDTGDVTRAFGLAVSTDYQVHQSCYARLCQAAIYIGRTEICACSKQPMSSLRIAEIMSLVEELGDFSAVMDSAPGISNSDNFIRLLAPRCLAYSGLFVVLESFICPMKPLSEEAGLIVSSGAKSEKELELQASSMQAIQQASKQAHNLAMELSARIKLDDSLQWQLGKVSPFMLHLMYFSMATSYWLLGENGDEVNWSSLTDIKSLMETLGSRWRLCKKYIEIASFQDRLGERGTLLSTGDKAGLISR